MSFWPWWQEANQIQSKLCPDARVEAGRMHRERMKAFAERQEARKQAALTAPADECTAKE